MILQGEQLGAPFHITSTIAGTVYCKGKIQSVSGLLLQSKPAAQGSLTVW